MTLGIQARKVAFQDVNDLDELLTGAMKHSEQQKQDHSIGKVWLYPARATRNEPQFGMASGIFVEDLTWADAGHILSAILGYYAKSDGKQGISYVIEDSNRGSMGNGVVKAKANDLGGEGSTSTS